MSIEQEFNVQLPVGTITVAHCPQARAVQCKTAYKLMIRLNHSLVSL